MVAICRQSCQHSPSDLCNLWQRMSAAALLYIWMHQVQELEPVCRVSSILASAMAVVRMQGQNACPQMPQCNKSVVTQEVEPIRKYFIVAKRISLFLARSLPQLAIDHLVYEISAMLSDEDALPAKAPPAAQVGCCRSWGMQCILHIPLLIPAGHQPPGVQDLGQAVRRGRSACWGSLSCS